MPEIKSQFSIFQWLFLMGIFLILLSSCQNKVPAAKTSLENPSLENTPTSQPDFTATPEGISIAKIQASGHISPYRNQNVLDVPGIVTVLDFDGFYMQSQTPDQNPDTSEGIFVFTEFIPQVKPGDEVRVDGMVEELTPGGGYGNLSITQIRNPKVRVLSSGNDLPAPIIIGEGGRIPPSEVIDDDTNGFISENVLFDPQNDGIDFYESLESMLVQVNNAVVVGPTNTYKEIVVLADMGLNTGIRSPRGGIVIRENDYNPERIMLDDKFQEIPFVNVGDFSESPIIGVMDYDFGNFKIQIISEAHFTAGKLKPQSPLEPHESDQLRIASYNVLNLSAIEPQRISVLGEQIVNQMGSPDIIGLQEIQDNDGSVGQQAVSADQTYQGIIDAILDAGGPQYAYADIDPIPGTDGGIPLGNIRQGFLYRTDRGLSLADAPRGEAKTPVALFNNNGIPELSLNPGRIDPTAPAFYSSRKPLVAAFNYQGQPLFVINNHFNSKGEDRDLFGEFQPPILDSEIQRLAQAQIVHDFVSEILAINPESRVVVLGDLNDFQFSNPIKLLAGDILQNLVLTLPEEERYAYIYEGNGQTLDHILVSEAMTEDLVSFDILHINSEFEYSARFSDHDPLIATFKMD